MAKDIDEIEGGDSSSDSGEFTGDLPDKPDVDTASEEEDVGSKPDDTPEELRFEHGDDDWDKDQDDKEEEEEVEKEEIKEEDKEEKKELSEEEKQDEKIKEDVINYLKEDGGNTKYVVKGKEYDMRDLSPQEFRDRFSKAGRFYERMEEISAKEKIINERERLAEDGARRSQEIMRKYGGEPFGETEKVPDIFKPHEDDEDEVKTLKEANANLYKRVDKLERDGEQQGFEAQKQDLYRQLDSLEREFPMLSKSEVIAVKSMPEYAGIDIRTIAENSHNARMSDEYLDSVFKARPDKLRELNEKAIEKHLMKNPKVRKVSRKKSSTVASGKVSSSKKKTPRTFDEIEDHLDSFKRDLDEIGED